jgi:hypothetical protein
MYIGMQPINANAQNAQNAEMQTQPFTNSIYAVSNRGEIEVIDKMTADIEETRFLTYRNYNQYKNIKVHRNCKNICEFLSKHADDLMKIRPKTYLDNDDFLQFKYEQIQKHTFQQIYGSKKYHKDLVDLHNLLYIEVKKYKYLSVFKNEKDMNRKIFKLIVDVLYRHEGGDKRKIVEKLLYMHNRVINYDYFYMHDTSDTFNLYSVTRIFKWIKKCIKGKPANAEYKKIFENVCEFIHEHEQESEKLNFVCNLCDEETVYVDLKKNCVCNDNICANCYKKLNPVRCPFCRTTPFKLSINASMIVPAKRKITYHYNNKVIKCEYDNFKNLEDETVFFFDGRGFNSFRILIRDEEKLITDYIEEKLEGQIVYFEPQFLHNYFNPAQMSLNLFTAMMEHIRYESDYGADLLELFELSTDYEDEYTRDFIYHIISVDGIDALGYDDNVATVAIKGIESECLIFLENIDDEYSTFRRDRKFEVHEHANYVETGNGTDGF